MIEDNPPSSTSIPRCIVCTLLFFTAAIILLCASLIFAFLRLASQYKQIQELIDKLPSAELIADKLVQSNHSDIITVERYKNIESQYNKGFDRINVTLSNKMTILGIVEENALKSINSGRIKTHHSISRVYEEIRLIKQDALNMASSLEKNSQSIIKSAKSIDDSAEGDHLMRIGVLGDNADKFRKYTANDLIPNNYQYLHVFQRNQMRSPIASQIWPGTNWITLTGNGFSNHFLEAGSEASKLPFPSKGKIFQDLQILWEKAGNINQQKRGNVFINKSYNAFDRQLSLALDTNSKVPLQYQPLATPIVVYKKRGAASFWN